MSKSRKILGALLAVVMVISMFSICAFAAGDTFYENAEDAAKYTQSWSLGTPVSQGGTTYTVQVMLSTNYPVGPIAFRLEGANVTGVVAGSEYYSNPLSTTSDTGMVLMIPDTTDTVPAISVNGHIATVTYTTNNANGVVTIANDPKNADNPGGSLVAARCTAGTVNASNFGVGQVASVGGEIINPPAVETPVLTGVNGAVVNDSNNYVYGIPGKTADVKTYLSTTGYVEVAANDAGVKNGTGAVINLYTDSSKGTLVKSYTLVIFGDLDGDGEVALPDAGILSQYANYVTDADSLTGAYYFAGDLDGDGETALPDSGILSQYANYVTDTITVNPWA